MIILNTLEQYFRWKNCQLSIKGLQQPQKQAMAEDGWVAEKQMDRRKQKLSGRHWSQT